MGKVILGELLKPYIPWSLSSVLLFRFILKSAFLTVSITAEERISFVKFQDQV